jgi:hypothetical protein
VYFPFLFGTADLDNIAGGLKHGYEVHYLLLSCPNIYFAAGEQAGIHWLIAFSD